MRIIKEGKIERKLPVFACKHCGCEFECNNGEYWTDNSLTSLSYPPQDTVVANCPNCHKICTATFRTLTPKNITVTGTNDAWPDSNIYVHNGPVPKVTLENKNEHRK